LCACAAAIAGPDGCPPPSPPNPYQIGPVTTEAESCHQARFTWTLPVTLPTQYRLLVQNRPVLTLQPHGISAVVSYGVSKADHPRAIIQSLGPSGEVLAARSFLFDLPECVVKPVLRVKVIPVDLNPPNNNGPVITQAELGAFFFYDDDSVGAAIAQASFGRQRLIGDVHSYIEMPGSTYCTWNGTSYAFCNDEQMIPDALAIADPSIDFSQYDRVAFVFPTVVTGGASWIRLDTDEGEIPVYYAPVTGPLPLSGRITLHLHELGHLGGADEPNPRVIYHAGTLSGCTSGLFPADPSNVQADCLGSYTADIEPLGTAGGPVSVHPNAVHKERMGYLTSDHVLSIDLRPTDVDVDLYDITKPASGYQLVRVRLQPYGYDYFAEYRNETLPNGRLIRGVFVRLSRRIYQDHDTLNPSIGTLPPPLKLSGTVRVFDDPNQNVRIEWIQDFAGNTGARVRVGPSRGMPLP
jgi:hypothetical protein